MKLAVLVLAFFLVLGFGNPDPALAANNLKECLTRAKMKNVPESEFKAFMSACMKQNDPNSLSDEKKQVIKARIASCISRADQQNLQGSMRKMFLRTCLGS